MTLLHQFKDLSAQIKELNAQSGKIQQAIDQLEQQQTRLAAQIVVEENLLKGTEWTIKYHKGSGDDCYVYLDYLGRTDDKELERLIELTWKGHHSTFYLEKGVAIYFNDNDMTLHITDTKQVKTVINKYGLVIVSSNITKRLQQLKEETESLQELFQEMEGV